MKRGRKPGSLCRCTCVACGAVEIVGGSGRKYRCQACRTAGRYGDVAPSDATGAIADAIDATQPTVSRILSGRHKDPRYSVVEKLRQLVLNLDEFQVAQ